MMKVYLDTSVYNRLYDDQTQAKVYLETQAILVILNLIETQQIASVGSSVLDYENKKNPFPVIQSSVQMYLSRAIYFQPLNEDIRERAKVLEIEGIKPIDALHVASFEASQSNFFLTCDKRLLNRCQALSISALNPIDLIKELDDEN